MEPGDKYCRYCGGSKVKGKFRPEDNDMYCVYGPPIIQKFTCLNCGHKWETFSIGRKDNSRYCTQCGVARLKVETENDY